MTSTTPSRGWAGPFAGLTRTGALTLRGRGWALAVLAVALMVVFPVALVASSLLTPTGEVWRHLWATQLREMLVTTLALMAGVTFGTLLLGAGLAWLTTVYRFPGSRAFGGLLVLPLAMPAYVLGFVFLSLFSYPGPVQRTWRAMLGPAAWFPEVRSTLGAALVLSLTLYPYVYLLARAALREQAATTFEAARTLGCGRLRAAWRVVLPLARPSLAAGLTLVLMETLTDYATVQYFNVETISVGVYSVWKGMGDRTAATELAAVVLLFALAVVVVERLLRGRARYWQQGGAARGLEAVPLRGVRAWVASATCASVLALAFVVPLLQLLAWSGDRGVRGSTGRFDSRYLEYFGHSALLAGLSAVVCVALAVLVSNGARLDGGRLSRSAAHLSALGYMVPGPVVAIGVLVAMAGLDQLLHLRGVLLVGSLAGLVYAYVIRFLALAYNTTEASLQKVSPSMTMAARTLGSRPRQVLRRVHLPLMRSGLVVALVLVLLDAMKELSIVLLLRPFGFDTLSVWVWQLASESRWESAGLPALTIVAVALVPAALVARSTGLVHRPPETAVAEAGAQEAGLEAAPEAVL